LTYLLGEVAFFTDAERNDMTKADLNTNKKRSKILILTVVIQVAMVVVFILRNWSEFKA